MIPQNYSPVLPESQLSTSRTPNFIVRSVGSEYDFLFVFLRALLKVFSH